MAEINVNNAAHASVNNLVMTIKLSNKTKLKMHNELIKSSKIKRQYQNLTYHVTVGVIENVESHDQASLKAHITKLFRGKLSSLIPSSFNIGGAQQFSKGRLVVFNPTQPKFFARLNKELANEVSKIALPGRKRYKLNALTLPTHYKSHMTVGYWDANAYKTILKNLNSYRLKRKKPYNVLTDGIAVFYN